jgi:peptide/nickel transport system permease protein
MWRFIAARFLRLLVVLALVTLGTALLLQLVPGDPAVELAGESATPEQIEAIRERTGLDDPLPVQYGRWLSDLLQGDLGTSTRTNVPVTESISQRLPVTLEIAVLATILAAAVAIPLGIATAQRQGSRFDQVVSAASSGVVSMPPFLVGLLLVLVFAINFGWFSVTGWARLSDGLGDHLRTVVLPVVAVAATEIVVLQRVLRAELIATLQQPYMEVARAKGLPLRYRMWRHALKPSSFAMLTLAALSFGRLLGGTIVVETVFSLPGLGRLMVTSIQSKDLVVVQGLVAFVAVVYLTVNFATDVLYAVIDPRVRSKGAT